MAQWTLRQTISSLALATTTVLLASCGGSSGGGSNANVSPDTSSAGSSSSLYAQASVTSAADAPPAQTAPKSQDRLLASVTTYSTTSASLVASDTAGPAGQDPAAYDLTFHEDFNNSLDRNVWDIYGIGGSSSSTTNYATSNGSLKIWPERGSNGEFFDRTLDTSGQFSQQYGFFEMEAKLPKGNGVWPAFWLLSMSGEKRPEIDILEAYPGGAAPWGTPGADGIPAATMYAPVVWRDATDQAGYAKVATPDLSEDFHRYGAKWEPNKVTFYFDGEEVHSVDASLSEPMFIILNLWFGSASGEPDASTPAGESNAYEVNYVKAWQFK